MKTLICHQDCRLVKCKYWRDVLCRVHGRSCIRCFCTENYYWKKQQSVHCLGSLHGVYMINMMEIWITVKFCACDFKEDLILFESVSERKEWHCSLSRLACSTWMILWRNPLFCKLLLLKFSVARQQIAAVMKALKNETAHSSFHHEVNRYYLPDAGQCADITGLQYTLYIHVCASYWGNWRPSEDGWTAAAILSEAAISFIRQERCKSGEQMIMNSRTKWILQQDKEWWLLSVWLQTLVP